MLLSGIHSIRWVSRINRNTGGLCIFTNLEHFSASILKIGGSIPHDSIANPTDPEIIAEAISLGKSLKSLSGYRQPALSLQIQFYVSFLL